MTEEKTTTEEVKAEATEKATTKTESKSSDNRSGGNRPQRGGRRNNRRRKKEPKEFEEAVIQIDRVTRVTKGGRQLRFRVSMVIGDQKGRVGFGTGKSSEVMLGIQKGIAKAKRNLINVPIVEDSIPHAVNYKFKATRVLLFPAPEGKGVIAGSSVRKVLELSGIKNVLSKMHGSRNRLNAAYATIEALKMLKNKAPHKSAKKLAEEAEKKAEADKAQEKAEKADKTAKTTENKKPAKNAAPKKDAPVKAKKEDTKKTVAKPVVKKSETKSGAKDDLTKIEGIGPKIAEHLNNAGITTFAELAKTKTEKIQEVLDNAGPRYKIHNPKTWAKQSQMAADGKWDELKKWQDELDGGK